MAKPLKEVEARIAVAEKELAERTALRDKAREQFDELHKIFLAEHENQVVARDLAMGRKRELEAQLGNRGGRPLQPPDPGPPRPGSGRGGERGLFGLPHQAPRSAPRPAPGKDHPELRVLPADPLPPLPIHEPDRGAGREHPGAHPPCLRVLRARPPLRGAAPRVQAPAGLADPERGPGWASGSSGRTMSRRAPGSPRNCRTCPSCSSGPLQRNKARLALTAFSEIMTVDRPELASRLAALAEELAVSRKVWIQVDLWEETTKMGGLPGAGSGAPPASDRRESQA